MDRALKFVGSTSPILNAPIRTTEADEGYFRGQIPPARVAHSNPRRPLHFRCPLSGTTRTTAKILLPSPRPRNEYHPVVDSHPTQHPETQHLLAAQMNGPLRIEVATRV